MPNILVIGATSAIARQVARIYADKSQATSDMSAYRLYVMGRNDMILDELLLSLGEAAVGKAVVDFTDYLAMTNAINTAFQVLGSFDYVLIAHGFIGDQLLSESDSGEALKIIDVNYASVVVQLILLTQLMSKQTRGKIGVITSVAGERGRPRNYTYGSAKGALSLYLQGLRSVKMNTGLEIYTFKLGPVDSPMTIDHPKNFSFSSVNDVAVGIVQAFEGRRYERYIPGYWAWVMWVVRWMPEAIFQKMGFLSNR